jgi:DnaJ-class molecular chaperone
MKVCPECHGQGRIEDEDGNIVTCPECHGSGVVDDHHDDDPGTIGLRHWILAGARRASACCRGHGPRSRFGIRSIHESQRTGKGDHHIWKLQRRAA